MVSPCLFWLEEELSSENSFANHYASRRSERVESKARVSGNRNALEVHEDCLNGSRNAAIGPRSSR
jgi:hypothetical protein